MPWLDNLLDKNPIKRIGPPSFSPAANFCLKQTLNRLSGADRHEHNPEKQMDFLDYWVEIKEENPGVVGVNEIVGFLLINVSCILKPKCLHTFAKQHFPYTDHSWL